MAESIVFLQMGGPSRTAIREYRDLVENGLMHVGLIHCAVTISELIEARDARFRAWS